MECKFWYMHDMTSNAFTARRKVRCVGCGNYLAAGDYTANQLYAGGLDVISLRCCLVLMVSQMWSAGVADIKTGFLNAELQPEDLGAKRVVIRTPGLWRRLGICEETFWDVHRAMYGLAISPAAWARCRDRTLPSLRLKTYLGLMRLVQFKSDSNIWAIVPEDAEEPVSASLRRGLLFVCVDDLMVLGVPQMVAEIIAELGKKWDLSSPEFLEEGNLHYRGVEIQRCNGGVLVHQGAYTQELLSRYPDQGGADVPALKLPEAMPLRPQDPQTVRRAQQVAGELLWLAGLTRPEIQFSVGAISRMISVNAEEALALPGVSGVVRPQWRGARKGTFWSRWAGTLWLGSVMPASLRQRRDLFNQRWLFIIAWSSTRQNHTTLSTAEAELVGITSLFGELQALEPLVTEIQGNPLTIQMHSDSQAAIAICTTLSSNWRTRHLRLRAAYVKEMLESGRYSLYHIKGRSMKADIGTKPLPAPRFQQLVESLGMTEPALEAGKRVRVFDGALDERVRALLTCLVVASLLSPAEADDQEDDEHGALGGQNLQFLLGLVVATVCCWEGLKCLVYSCCRGCRCIVLRCRGDSQSAHADSPGVHVVRHVDDVVMIGPPAALGRQLEIVTGEVEELTAFERPGAPPPVSSQQASSTGPRRRARRQDFVFNDVEFESWPAVLSMTLNPVGQDRYEYRPGRRTVLRWHLDARVRLFCPSNTCAPVALEKFTGKRRTWVIDVTAGSTYGRRLHLDNWPSSICLMLGLAALSWKYGRKSLALATQKGECGKRRFDALSCDCVLMASNHSTMGSAFSTSSGSDRLFPELCCSVATDYKACDFRCFSA